MRAIRCQCFIRIFLRFGVAGLKAVTKAIIFLDVLGLFCKAVLRIENFISVKISSAKLLGYKGKQDENCVAQRLFEEETSE